jgi:hypothetical protein
LDGPSCSEIPDCVKIREKAERKKAMKKNSMRLLGFLLMAVMMVSLFAVGVFAEDTANVAKIGDTEYATLQAAITAANAGDTTITLLRDCGGSVSIKQESGAWFAYEHTLREHRRIYSPNL